MSSTIYSPGDVLMVNYIFTDQQRTKVRPVVVLSDDAYRQSRGDIVTMALSTQPPVHLDAPLVDWKAAKLPLATNAKAVIQTIETTKVNHRLGVLAQQDFEMVKAIARKMMNL